MKKIAYFAAISALILTGCSKELNDNRTSDVPTGKTVTITASMGENIKSTFNKTEGFAWKASENISVGTSDGEYVSFTCDDAENGIFSHMFASAVPELLVAVSPAQSGSFTSGSEYVVTLPAEYTYDRRTTNALMVGTLDPDGEDYQFFFRHAAALMRVTYQNIPAGATGFRLETDKPITGSFTLSGTGASNIEIKNDNPALSSGSKVVTILFSEATTTQKDVTFYIPVPTGTYSTVKMNLIGNDATLATSSAKSLSGSLTIERGQVFELPTVTLASGFAPYTVGATDNTTGWWGAHSESYQVPEGKTLHLEFVNHSSKSNNEIWHNWTAIFSKVALGQNPYVEYLALRADYWGWTPAGDFNSVEGLRDKGTDSNLMGDDFVSLMDGAYVTMTVKNESGVMHFKSVCTPASESDKAKTRTITFDLEIDGDLYLFLTTDLSHFDIEKVWYSGYKAAEEEDVRFIGYRSGYDYYVYDTALALDVIGTPRRIVAAYSDGSTEELTASDFTFTTGQTLAATAGDQVFTATYGGEPVNVTIPVKVGTGAFGSTTLVTNGLVYSPFFGELSAGQSASKKLFVYSSCPNNWASPCADCASANFATFYCSLRMDNFGWGDYYATATATSNWNWDKFTAYQNHNTVTMTWTANNANQGTMRFDVTYWDGDTHFQQYATFYINQVLAYRAFTENSYVVVIE